MKNRSRRVKERVAKALAYALIGVLVGISLGVPKASAATVVRTGDGSSCIASMDGRDSSFSLSNGTWYTVRFKCYYQTSPATPTGFAGYFHDASYADVTGPTSNCLLWASANNAAVVVATNWSVRNFVRDVTATGYVEYHFDLRKNSGVTVTQTIPTTLNAGIGFGLDGDCNVSTLGDMKQLGRNAVSDTKIVAASSYATTDIPARWDVAYSTYPFCGATVTVTRVKPVEKDSVWTAATNDTVISNGDGVEFSTTWTSGRTEFVQVNWPGMVVFPSVFGVDPFETTDIARQKIMVAGTLANPVVTQTVARLPASYAGVLFRVRDIQLQCYDTVLGANFYVKLADPTTSAGDGRPRPCDLARFYWPKARAMAAGETDTWYVNYSGTPSTAATFTTIDVDYATYDSAAGSAPGFSTLTWTNIVDDAPLGYHGNVVPTAGFTATTSQFLFRCTDYLGTTYGSQWLYSVRFTTAEIVGTEGVGRGDLSSCFAAGGLELNPSSWLPAAGRMGGCVITWFFMPTDGYVSNQIVGFNEQFEASVVGQTFAAADNIGDFVGAMSASYASDCDADRVDLPLGSGHEASISFLDACEGTSAVVRDVVWTLLNVGFLVAGCVAVFNTGMSVIGTGAQLSFDDDRREARRP